MKQVRREPREKPVALLNWLASLPHSYWSWHPSGLVGIRGVYRGRAIAIEVGPLYEERFYNLGKMKRAGAFVCYSNQAEMPTIKWFMDVVEDVCLGNINA